MGERRHDYCEMVLKNNRELGAMTERVSGMDDDIKHIRKKIDNGLSEQMKVLSERLETLKKDTWLIPILNTGVKKFLVGVILFSLVVGSTFSGIYTFTRIGVFKETPGQMKVIENAIMSNGYMLHVTKEGYKVMTANNPDKPAWIFNATLNQWQPAPHYRVIR